MSEVNNVPQGQIVRNVLASALSVPRLLKNPSIAADQRYKNAKTAEERLEVVNQIVHERAGGKTVRDKMATTFTFKGVPSLFTQGVMQAFSTNDHKIDRNEAETIIRNAASEGFVIIDELDGNFSIRLEEKKVAANSNNGNSKLDKLKLLMTMSNVG